MGLTLFEVGVVIGCGVYSSDLPDPPNWLETVVVLPEAHKSPFCVHLYTKILTVFKIQLQEVLGELSPNTDPTWPTVTWRRGGEGSQVG